jgi:hypothetical protein
MSSEMSQARSAVGSRPKSNALQNIFFFFFLFFFFPTIRSLTCRQPEKKKKNKNFLSPACVGSGGRTHSVSEA